MAPRDESFAEWFAAHPHDDDAFVQTLAGVAERVIAGEGLRVAAREGVQRPHWSIEPERFLERFWFLSDVPGFRATALAQSPAAFRRRGIMIARDALTRV